ncbi:P-loop containing nucleoside triphosphate hydrolase protein [Glomus cerebriforme]|uniref:P-loop containing nucleoside triphosphate hydrolase protein n=1 Tax=Glomus cerebriforme TaxID=658196 RepID=A0A397TN57_9GLOM|nr:P-loop containing nucleoside triphosphate hydrolase protein [Glomus cerebriforme]
MNLLRTLSRTHFRSHQLIDNFHQVKIRNIRNDWKIRPYSNTARQSEVFKKYWNVYKPVMTDPSNKSIRNKILSTTGVGIVTYYFYSKKSPSARVKKMSNVFKKGKFEETANPKNLVERKDLEDTLSKILQPSLHNYYLIMGTHGTGKTTLIQNTILKLKKPKGVVHFKCPSDVNEFSKELAKHLDCELYPDAGRQSKYADWSLLRRQLVSTAHYYMKTYKRPMVLILDQIDRIAKKDPEFLGILQDFAKDYADKGSIIIVFVSSESLIPRLLQSRSAWSRATTLQIGDISDEAAVKFLQDSGIEENISKYAVKYLTGGRFTLLNLFQNKYKMTPKNVLEEYKKHLFMSIKEDMRSMKLPKNHKIFIKLIESHAIDIDQATNIIPLDMIRELIEANILRHQNYTVSFHSRYVENYFKEVNKTESKI